MKKVIALVTLSLSLLTAVSAFAETKPFIESIVGPSPVNVIKNGNTEEAEEGRQLAEKDQIQTGAQSSTRISYPDGSQLVLGRDSLLELDAVDANGAHGSHLISGVVQAIIEKRQQNVAQGTSKAPTKYKFFIRTESAVMGVRGTEFIVDQAKDASTQLHTLSGTVDVAQNQTDFSQGKVSSVHENETLKADGKSLGAPAKFDRNDFLQKFHNAQPEAHKIAERAVRTRRHIRATSAGARDSKRSSKKSH